LAANHLDKALSIDEKHQKSIALLCDIYLNHSEYKKALELLKHTEKRNSFSNFLVLDYSLNAKIMIKQLNSLQLVLMKEDTTLIV